MIINEWREDRNKFRGNVLRERVPLVASTIISSVVRVRTSRKFASVGTAMGKSKGSVKGVVPLKHAAAGATAVLTAAAMVLIIVPPASGAIACSDGIIYGERQADRDRASRALNQLVSDFGGSDANFYSGASLSFRSTSFPDGRRWDIISSNCKQAHPHLNRYMVGKGATADANCLCGPWYGTSGQAACPNGGLVVAIAQGGKNCENNNVFPLFKAMVDCVAGNRGSSCYTCTHGKNGQPCLNSGVVTGSTQSNSCGCTCKAGWSGANCETATCSRVDYVYTFGAWKDNGCGNEQTRVEAETCGAARSCTCSNQRSVKSETQAGRCCAVNYAYTFGAWKDNGCGNEQTRVEAETCGAARSCTCSNQRSVATETQAGPCCGVDYAYTWVGWSDNGCGKEQSRVESESCSAASGCTCSNQRSGATERRAGPCCAAYYSYSFGGWGDNGCGKEQSRVESESCSAASGCTCSNQRSVATETQAGPCCVVDYAYTFGAWKDNGCGTQQSRVEAESCSAASGCTCSNQRSATTERRAATKTTAASTRKPFGPKVFSNGTDVGNGANVGNGTNGTVTGGDTSAPAAVVAVIIIIVVLLIPITVALVRFKRKGQERTPTETFEYSASGNAATAPATTHNPAFTLYDTGLVSSAPSEGYGSPYSSCDAPLSAQHFYERVVSTESETPTLHFNLITSLLTTLTVGLRAAVDKAAVHCCLNSDYTFEGPVDDALAFGKELLADEHKRQQQESSSDYESPRQFPQEFTEPDAAAIHIYTQHTPLYPGLNGALGGWGRDGVAAAPHYLQYAKLLLNSCSKLPTYSGRLYRGVCLPLSVVLGGLGVGDILEHRSITSTSRSADVLRDKSFLGIGDEGVLPDNGERVVFQYAALSAVSISRFSSFKGEEEYLLLPGTRFMIDSIKRSGKICYQRESACSRALVGRFRKGDEATHQRLLSRCGGVLLSLSADERVSDDVIAFCRWEFGVVEVQLHELPPDVPGRVRVDPLGVYGSVCPLYEDINHYLAPTASAGYSTLPPLVYDQTHGEYGMIVTVDAPSSTPVYDQASGKVVVYDQASSTPFYDMASGKDTDVRIFTANSAGVSAVYNIPLDTGNDVATYDRVRAETMSSTSVVPVKASRKRSATISETLIAAASSSQNTRPGSSLDAARPRTARLGWGATLPAVRPVEGRYQNQAVVDASNGPPAKTGRARAATLGWGASGGGGGGGSGASANAGGKIKGRSKAGLSNVAALPARMSVQPVVAKYQNQATVDAASKAKPPTLPSRIVRKDPATSSGGAYGVEGTLSSSGKHGASVYNGFNEDPDSDVEI